jgi:hypothetical protein
MYASKGYVAASVTVLALAIVVLLSIIAARSPSLTDPSELKFELRKSLR